MLFPINKQTILIILGIILIFGVFSFVIYKQHELSKQQEAIQGQIIQTKQLADNINRAMDSWATKEDLNNFAKQNNLNIETIRNDLKSLNANLTAIDQTTIISKPQQGNNLPSTTTTAKNSQESPIYNVATIECDGKQIACPNPDKYDYLNKRQVLHLDEQFSGAIVPFANVGFSAWQEKPWDINVPVREYNLSTVLGTDDNQRQYAYNKFSIKTDGKEISVPITKNTFLQEYPTSKFTLWNPHLFLGLDGGVNLTKLDGVISPVFSIALSSYDKFKTNPKFSIFQIGAGYNMVNEKAAVFSLTPVSVNIGSMLFKPFMNNLYVGPSVGVSTKGDMNVNMGIRVGL